MAEEKNVMRINTKVLELDVKAATNALKGLDSVLDAITDGLKEAFSVKGYRDYKNTVTRFGKALADELLVLQLSFGRMKYAIAEAVAPIAAVFVPMLNTAIRAVIRFAGVVGQFLQALIGGVAGNNALTDSANNAVRSEKKLASAAKSAGKAVRRSLAGFDEIERLNAPTASGGSGAGGTVDLWGGFTPDPISPQVQALVDRILALLQPLLSVDLTPLRTALQSLWASLTQLAGIAADALGFLWYEILTPFAAWVVEELAPALTEYFAAKLDAIAAATGPVVEGIQILWQALQPVAAFLGDVLLAVLEQLRQGWLELSRVFGEKSPVIVGVFRNIASMASSAWAVVGPVLEELAAGFTGAFGIISETVGTTVGYLLDALYGLTAYLSGAFSGDWNAAWEGIKAYLKSVVNGIIGLLNGMIARLVNALNTVVRAANKLSFTLPGWIPDIGGKTFGLHLPTVTAPKIPYLAQGAVLPANRPFLAMVGDQRHGTNVEAPLSTIQEAVAVVMGDQIAAMMAGFEALLAENQQLRRVVEGIELGDTTIGQAAGRYQQKMAIMRGV